jgi:alkaline phosphatase
LNQFIQLLIVLGVFSFTNILMRPSSEQVKHAPENIIFIVGDGMGLGQITASMYTRKDHSSVFDQFPVTGMIATHSGKQLITDSAAGATAFSCGCKTYNGAIGVDMKKRPCPTLLETADSLGMATGIVVSSSLTHATPAAFYAHVGQRSDMEDIAVWMVQQHIDFLVGGGLKYFIQRKKDNRNLVLEMKKAGYQMSFNQHDSLPAVTNTEQPFCWFTAKDEPVSAKDGRFYMPEMTEKGISFLQQRTKGKGFFLLIEGSQIDWTGHANDKEGLTLEMSDFEATVRKALDFAQKDGNTLVVITADHETGGMGILQGSNQDTLEIKYTTKYHTGTMVPVFAYGPGSENFNGMYQNTDIFFRINKAMNWQ